MGLLNDFLSGVDNLKRKASRNIWDAVSNPSDFANMTAARMQEDRYGGPEEAAAMKGYLSRQPYDAQALARANDALVSNAVDAGIGAIVSPSKAMTLNIQKILPEDELFKTAVNGTKGAEITDDGLRMMIQRSQQPEQSLAPSVRGGVFYLPEGASQAKYYSTGKNGYGGKEKIAGETLVMNPLFVKGATGGKAPETAYDQLLGKGSYQNMRNDALNVNWGRRGPNPGPSADEFLDKYAPELSGMGSYILQNSQKGNQLAYALQEAAVASAVRNAGHDAVLGYSKGKAGPFISEVFDVRESHYPDKFGTAKVWEGLLK